MKNKYALIIAILVMSVNLLMAQAPGTVNYQGVARDTTGNPVANQSIRLRFKIHDNTATGAVEFTEVRRVTTSPAGLFNCQIGGPGAVSQSGSLLTLPWHDGNKFLQVEMDPTGGTSFKDLGAQQLASVPYALNARLASGLAPNTLLPFAQIDTTHASSGNILMFDGYSWGPSKLLPMNMSDPNLVSFGISNTSALGGTAIYGQATTNSSNATGVKGEVTQANGRGVYGLGNGVGSIGVLGSSTSGTALKGTSTTGFALETNGKLKITGGNTNPGKGKVLTSDSLGNATWEGAVAFSAYASNTTKVSNVYSTWMHHDAESYDLSNNFDTATHQFTAPVNGIYHFDATVCWSTSQYSYSGELNLTRIRNGYHTGLAECISNLVAQKAGTNLISIDVQLNAGDKVFVEVHQASPEIQTLLSGSTYSYFNGRLAVKL